MKSGNLLCRYIFYNVGHTKAEMNNVLWHRTKSINKIMTKQVRRSSKESCLEPNIFPLRIQMIIRARKIGKTSLTVHIKCTFCKLFMRQKFISNNYNNKSKICIYTFLKQVFYFFSVN